MKIINFLFILSVMLFCAEDSMISFDKYGLWVDQQYQAEIIFDIEYLNNELDEEWLFEPFQTKENYNKFVLFVIKEISHKFERPRINKIFRSQKLKDCFAFLLDDASASYNIEQTNFGFFMNMKTNKIVIFKTPDEFKLGYTALVPRFGIESINRAFADEQVSIKNNEDALNLSVFLLALLNYQNKVNIVKASSSYLDELKSYKVELVEVNSNIQNKFVLIIGKKGNFSFESKQKMVDGVWNNTE